jgi:hypothetical protein
MTRANKIMSATATSEADVLILFIKQGRHIYSLIIKLYTYFNETRIKCHNAVNFP